MAMENHIVILNGKWFSEHLPYGLFLSVLGDLKQDKCQRGLAYLDQAEVARRYPAVLVQQASTIYMNGSRNVDIIG